MNQHAHHRHAHGHHHDRGGRAVLRYARLLPMMWRSDVNEAVVRELAVTPGEQVVDVGCGAGAAAVVAADLGANVLAVDPMPLMRTVLGLRRLWHARRGTITVVDGAAEAIPARDGTIDALWSVNTLHHWTNVEAASRELARVLKPGGRVLLLDEEFSDSAHQHHHEHQARRARSGLVFDEVDPVLFAKSLKQAGFAVAEGSRTQLVGRPVKLVRATR